MGACVVYGCSPVLGALLVSHRKEYKVFCKNFSKYFSVLDLLPFCCLAEFVNPISKLRFRVAGLALTLPRHCFQHKMKP